MSKSSPQGPQHLGKYELQEQLGRGGMAEVWKGFDTQLHRYVAIKLLHADLQTDPQFITRFSREARVIASLRHPNIVQIHDFQTTHPPEANAPVAYMVMDYIEGQTLAHYMRITSRAGKFPSPIDIVHLFTSISKAIDYAHQEGMIHRDIKPANILLDKRNSAFNPMGEPMLTDFGIAKLMGATSGTMSGMWLGTPLYISPEQAQGYPGNERSDIYSLGIILYEMCTGVQPFRGENVAAIMVQHIHSMPTSPALINPNIPPALAMVILCALAKDPAARFSSASAMTVAMAEAFNLPIPADLPSPTFPMEDLAKPTYFSPFQQTLVPRMMNRSEPLSQPVPPVMTPQFTTPLNRGPGTPATPISSTPAFSSPSYPTENLQTAAPSWVAPGTLPPTPPSPLISKPWRREKGLFIALLIILLLLAGSSIGVFYVLPGKSTSPTFASKSPVVGNVFFLNSGQLNAQNSQGVDDEVQVDLHNIPNPAPGKSYYAWLVSDQGENEGNSQLLGPLNVNQGNVHFLYKGNQNHTNLLLYTSRFLVTEEDSNPMPLTPSPAVGTWRFYSIPPQTTLLHLRHLLANSPELDIRQLYGGLAIWLLRNIEKINEWGGNARDDLDNFPVPDTGLIHRQLIHVLDYIDGKDYVQTDVPLNTPLLVNPYNAQIPLEGPQPEITRPPGYLYNGKGETPPGYIYLIEKHMNAAVSLSQATPEQRQLAIQIDNALNKVKNYLDEARKDARQLVPLDATQLVKPQARSILNDLAAATQNAYTGSIDVSTGQSQGGAVWIYSNIQRLATFEVQLYTSK